MEERWGAAPWPLHLHQPAALSLLLLSDQKLRGVESFRLLAKITAGFVNGLLPIHPSSQASHIY
jgi:hypothetical protein